MAFQYTFKFEQGASFDKTLTYRAGVNKTPVNLTGCTARAQFRLKNARKDLVLELSTANNTIILGDAAGTIRFVVDVLVTRRFNWAVAKYDVLLTFPDGTVKRLMQGEGEVSESQTHPF